MSAEEIQVEVIEIEGNQYQRFKENGNEFWCLRTIAQHCEVHYETIRYHLRDKPVIFEPFIRQYKVSLENSKGRPKLFLKIPEGLDQLRLYVRKLKNNSELNKIMSFISDIRKGEIVAARKEDIEQMQEQMLANVLQDMGSILQSVQSNQRVLTTEIVKLKGDRTFSTQHAQIISNLIQRYAEWHDLEGRTVWHGFQKAFGITGYRNAELKYFGPFVKYFYMLDKKVVASVFNEYRSKQYIDDEIIDDLLKILKDYDEDQNYSLKEFI